MKELFTEETHNVAGGYGYPNSYSDPNSYGYSDPGRLKNIKNGIDLGTSVFGLIGQGAQTYTAVRNALPGYQQGYQQSYQQGS
ncbi:hypothetical protein ACJ8HE_21575 [Serratia sp. CY31527]|uniref:hypothetical protein n=1 Tax=Serratia sp. CY31527 TaxID=3383597 RepID=UPI003FA03A70